MKANYQLIEKYACTEKDSGKKIPRVARGWNAQINWMSVSFIEKALELFPNFGWTSAHLRIQHCWCLGPTLQKFWFVWPAVSLGHWAFKSPYVNLTYRQGWEPRQGEKLKITATIIGSWASSKEGVALELGILNSHHGDEPQIILERSSVPELSFQILPSICREILNWGQWFLGYFKQNTLHMWTCTVLIRKYIVFLFLRFLKGSMVQYITNCWFVREEKIG